MHSAASRFVFTAATTNAPSLSAADSATGASKVTAVPSLSFPHLPSPLEAAMSPSSASFSSTMNVPTPITLASSPRPEWQCLYKGSVCTRVRTLKDDGAYHRFCDKHRTLAIRNQQRWLQRRRAKKHEATEKQHDSLSPLTETGLSMTTLEPLSDAEWFMLAAQLLDVHAPQPTQRTTTATRVDTNAPASLKTQRHNRRAQQAARLALPYLRL